MTTEDKLRNITIEIRRNSDGVIKSQDWKDWRWYVYWWEEGNASCDCNRSSFFHKNNEMSSDDHPCGDGGFSVRITDTDTKETLYDEFIQEKKP